MSCLNRTKTHKVKLKRFWKNLINPGKRLFNHVFFCFKVWVKFVVPVRTLCNGDLDRNIKVEVFDHNKSGNHSFIGEFFTTARQLTAGPGPENIYFCINPKKQVGCSSIFWTLYILPKFRGSLSAQI